MAQGGARETASVGCAALHPRLFKGDRYVVVAVNISDPLRGWNGRRVNPSPWVALRFTHGYSHLTATRSERANRKAHAMGKEPRLFTGDRYAIAAGVAVARFAAVVAAIRR